MPIPRECAFECRCFAPPGSNPTWLPPAREPLRLRLHYRRRLLRSPKDAAHAEATLTYAETSYVRYVPVPSVPVPSARSRAIRQPHNA